MLSQFVRYMPCHIEYSLSRTRENRRWTCSELCIKSGSPWAYRYRDLSALRSSVDSSFECPNASSSLTPRISPASSAFAYNLRRSPRPSVSTHGILRARSAPRHVSVSPSTSISLLPSLSLPGRSSCTPVRATCRGPAVAAGARPPPTGCI